MNQLNKHGEAVIYGQCKGTKTDASILHLFIAEKYRMKSEDDRKEQRAQGLLSHSL
jgi:hypothetical protein